LDDHPDRIHLEDPHDNIYFVPLIAFAIVGEHYELVEELLARGALVAPYSAQLLYLAARAGRMDILDLLVSRGAELISADPFIFTVVNDMEVFFFLLDHGVEVNHPGMNGFPPLVYMARGDKGESPEKVKALIEYGASVNAINKLGRTAIHYAAAAGYLEVIAILMANGANLSIRDHQGKTALDLALAAGKTAAAKLLTNS
jgi:ankyrin repeat protein